jgi:hypothetical protein
MQNLVVVDTAVSNYQSLLEVISAEVEVWLRFPESMKVTIH